MGALSTVPLLLSNFHFKDCLNLDYIVYVIGLHAVQFGNNCMKKIRRTAKIGGVLFGCQRNFLKFQLFPNWTACSPLTY